MKKSIMSLLTLAALTFSLTGLAQASVITYSVQSNGTIAHTFSNGNAGTRPSIGDYLATDGTTYTGGTTLPNLSGAMTVGDTFEIDFLAPVGKQFTINPTPGWTRNRSLEIYLGQPYINSGPSSSLGSMTFEWLNPTGTATPVTSEYEAFYFGANPSDMRIQLNISSTIPSDFSFTGFKASFVVPSGFSATYTNSPWQSSYIEFYNRNSANGSVTDPGVAVTLGNAPATVPEPSTYALLCISLGVVGYARKKHMKSAA